MYKDERSLLEIEVLTYDPADLSLPKSWNHIQASGKYDNPFMMFEWFQSLHEAFGDQFIFQSILQIKNKISNEIVALIPFAVKNITILPYFKVQGFLLMHSEPCYPAHLDFLVMPGWSKKVIHSLLLWLKTQNYSAWVFRGLTENSPTLGLLQNAVGPLGFFHREPSYFCPYLRLPSADKSKDWIRKTFKRKMVCRRKLERTFDVKKNIVTSEEELERVLNRFLEMHKKRWKDKSTITSSQQAINFLHLYCKKSLQKKFLRIFYLEIHNKVVAVDISFCHDKIFFSYQTAFDEDFKNYSLGAVKNILMLERAIEDGLTHWDLLRGNQSYKSQWTNGITHGQNAIVFSRNWKGLFFHCCYSFFIPLKSSVKILVAKLKWLRDEKSPKFIRPFLCEKMKRNKEIEIENNF